MCSINPEAQRRRNALRGLLVFTLPAAVLFGFINLQHGAYTLVLLNLNVLLISLGLLVAMHRKVMVESIGLIYLMVVFTSIVAALARPEIHQYINGWLTAIPFLSYLLLRPRLALPTTVSFLLLASVAYLAGAVKAPYRLELSTIAHTLIPTLGFFIVCHYYAHSRVRSSKDMLARILTDPLTDLGNREKLMDEFKREQHRAQRTGRPFSLVLIDLDHFKKVNDGYGHDAGDEALVFVARLLETQLRVIDVFCRIGGEEFVVLLPDTKAAGAIKVAEDLRQTLMASEFHYRSEDISLTLSAGVVELGQDGDDWLHLYRAADRYLYECKERGRNCVASNAGLIGPSMASVLARV